MRFKILEQDETPEEPVLTLWLELNVKEDCVYLMGRVQNGHSSYLLSVSKEGVYRHHSLPATLGIALEGTQLKDSLKWPTE